jgi:hypothetical protein
MFMFEFFLIIYYSNQLNANLSTTTKNIHLHLELSRMNEILIY